MNLSPVHPALVHLPIAFVLLSVAADFGARLSKLETRRAAFRTLGFWSLVAALIGGVLSILAGYFDLRNAALAPDTYDFARLHALIGWILGISLAILTAWRWLIWHRGQMTINNAYLVSAAIVLSVVLFQGWYGGQMVYAYGAGVAATGQGTQTTQSAQRALLAVRNLLEPGAAVGGAESPGGTNISSEVSGRSE